MLDNSTIVRPVQRPHYGWGVDGSTMKPNPGRSEYRCVDLKTGKVIFNTRIGIATNNITEFLAIIEALVLSHKMGLQIDIYSDSQTAVAWVKNMRYKTMFVRDENSRAVYKMLDDSVGWLKSVYQYKKYGKVKFWKTKKWGQIPADFGRAH